MERKKRQAGRQLNGLHPCWVASVVGQVLDLLSHGIAAGAAGVGRTKRMMSHISSSRECVVLLRPFQSR